MDESIKERPIRAYYDTKNRMYFTYSGGKKQRIRSAKRKKIYDIQEQLNKSSRGIMQIKKTPITQKLPNLLERYNPSTQKSEQLELASSLLTPEEYDEGLKAQKKIRDDEKELLKDIKKKIKDGRELLPNEKKLLPLLQAEEQAEKIATRLEKKSEYDITITPREESVIIAYAGNRKKVADRMRRELIIKKVMEHHGLTLADIPYNSWNGLQNGRMLYILLLKDFIDLLFSKDKNELYAFLTSGGNMFRVTNTMDKDTLIRTVLNRLSPSNYSIFTTNPANTLITQYKVKPIAQTEAKQIGTGKLPALYNDEIDAFFNNKQKYPYFGGVIAADEIHKLPKHIPIGFIMNLDNSDGSGTHWVSVYINNNAIYYYDPFGDDPTESFKKDIHKYITDMKIPIMLKLKVNKIQDQDTRSHRCGYFAIKFLDDIMASDGKSWKFSTRYIGDEPENNSKNGEDSIKKEFSYL